LKGKRREGRGTGIRPRRNLIKGEREDRRKYETKRLNGEKRRNPPVKKYEESRKGDLGKGRKNGKKKRSERGEGIWGRMIRIKKFPRLRMQSRPRDENG